MILKVFDSGWPAVMLIPNMIRDVRDRILNKYTVNRPTILVNSTWYTDDVDQQVQKYIQDNNIECVIVYSLADAHIANKSKYNIECAELGYYDSPGFYDFWAVTFHKLCPRISNLDDPSRITKPFMSLNRKRHEHRVGLVHQLRATGLTNKGIVTLAESDLTIPDDVPDHTPVAPEGGAPGIKNDVATLGRPDVWHSHFLNVVTETWWDINSVYFVSEKIYKPLLGERPFLVYSSDMGVKWLQDRKFEIYHDDFTDITNLDLRDHRNLVPFLEVLSEQPIGYLKQKYLDLREKIVYNKNRYDEYVNEQNLDKLIGDINAKFGSDSR